LSNILTILLHSIVIAVVVKAVPNTNLSSIDPNSTTITSVGDGNHDNFVRLLQGNSPPGVSFCSYVQELFAKFVARFPSTALAVLLFDKSMDWWISLLNAIFPVNDDSRELIT